MHTVIPATLSQTLQHLEALQILGQHEKLIAVATARLPSRRQHGFKAACEHVAASMRGTQADPNPTLFCQSSQFCDQKPGHLRIDQAVSKLIQYNSADAAIERALRALQEPEVRDDLESVLRSPFGCPSSVQVYNLVGHLRHFVQIAHNLACKGWTEAATTRYFAHHVIADLWSSRRCALMLAVAQLRDGVAGSRIKLKAIGRDGASHDVPVNFFLSAEGWQRIIFDGCVKVPRTSPFGSQPMGWMSAAVYVATDDIVSDVCGNTASLSGKAQALAWLIDEIKDKPDDPYARNAVADYMSTRWNVNDFTFRGLWSAARKAVPGNKWGKGGPRSRVLQTWQP